MRKVKHEILDITSANPITCGLNSATERALAGLPPFIGGLPKMFDLFRKAAINVSWNHPHTRRAPAQP